MRKPDSLDAKKIARAIPDHPWLEHLVILDETDSTNTYLKKLAASGAPEGTVVLAETQTAGRGRLGRSFLSPAGGLYMSVLLRPPEPPEQLLHLTAASAVAVQRSVKEVCGLDTGIKWTNDLVCRGRKLCGILTERDSTGAVVVGVGINCNQTGFDAQIADMATSVCLETGRPVNRNRLAGLLIHSFFALALTRQTQKEGWLRRFREACITVGRDVRLVRGDETRLAHADGIGENGELLVTYEDDTQDRISSGEVSVRGMYGYSE